MSFTKKFKKGDQVITNEKWAEDVGRHKASQGSTKCGVVVDEYQQQRYYPEHSYRNGLYYYDSYADLRFYGSCDEVLSQPFLHFVDFVDSNGIKHTLNASWLKRYIDPIVADAKDENGNTIYNKDERIKKFKERRKNRQSRNL